jgi:phage terminase small subunit
MPALKTKYERFCRAYVANPNAAEAARRAGYSADHAKHQGHRLLARPAIVARVAELRAELAARECLSLDALLAKLEIAFAAALEHDQPAVAARIVDSQARLAASFAKLRGGEPERPGGEPTRAALARIARQLGVAPPHDA